MMLVARRSTCWGLRAVYHYEGKAGLPFIAGRFWDGGAWTGCCSRTYRTREEARAAARRTRSSEKRSDGWKVVVTPIRLEIVARELTP